MMPAMRCDVPRGWRGGWFCGLLAWVALSNAVSARTPPAWIAPHLAADVTALAGEHSAVTLIESRNVRYIAEDRVRRVYRGAVRVMHQAGRDHARCAYTYNPETE